MNTITMRQRISSGSPFEEKIAYSRAIVHENWVFISGTTGFDYEKMEISENVAEQADQAFKNIAQALTQAQSSLADIVRITYILPNTEDFETCWPVLHKHLGSVRPAATFISAALLDPKMKIEIEVTAIKAAS